MLFIAGVVFCYFVVLTPAMDFLLNFNADEFNTQVRARDYYSFVTMLMLAMGLGVPDARGDARRLQAAASPRPEKLRKNRRYAIVVIAVLAALLPTIDPLSLILEMIPLILLYELSIWLAVGLGPARSAKCRTRSRPPRAASLPRRCCSTSEAAGAGRCRSPI